jgi:uncharacterized Tic20 family protein
MCNCLGKDKPMNKIINYTIGALLVALIPVFLILLIYGPLLTLLNGSMLMIGGGLALIVVAIFATMGYIRYVVVPVFQRAD